MIETKPSRQRDAPPKASPTPAFSALRCATKPENTKVLRGARVRWNCVLDEVSLMDIS